MATGGKNNVPNSGASSKPSLRQVERRLDNLKREVDEICEEDLPHLGVASPERKSLFYKANNLRVEVEHVSELFDRLSLRNENMTTSNFQSKKQEESKRLQMLQGRLDQILQQLEPDEIEEDYFRKVASHQGASVSDVNSVTDQVEEGRYAYEDEEEEEYDTDTDPRLGATHECMTDFYGKEEGDLSFKKGEVLTTVQLSDDGWWRARNSEGVEGTVPCNYLKYIGEEAKEAGAYQGSKQQTVSEGKKTPLEKQRSGRDLWDMIKQPKEKTSEFDVLKAMNAMPAGFRETTLGELIKNDSFKTSSWVVPKLSESNLSFGDLFWDQVNKQLTQRQTRITRTFTLQAARMIPPPGAGLEIKSRHVRIALWNGRKILSNVHTVRAIPVEENVYTWSFNPRITRTIPTLYDADLIVRSNADDKNINLLFELNYSYQRTTSGEKGEVSCGWSSLPLFENDSVPIANKTYELSLHGGTPYDKNVDLDPSVSLQGPPSLFQSLVRTNRQPRLSVKLTSYSRLSKDRFDLLPESLLTAQSNVKFIIYYREIVANVFLKDDSMHGGLVCDPVLACFPKTLDYYDVLDALKRSWDDKMKNNLRRSQKRDPVFMLSLFRKTFIETSFAIMQCVDFPPFVFADEEIEKERLRFILSFQENNDALTMLLSRQVRYRPMNTNKVAFDVLNAHSLPIVFTAPS